MKDSQGRFAAADQSRAAHLGSAVMNILAAALAAGGFVPLVVLVGQATARGSVPASLVVGVSLYGGTILYRFVMSATSSFLSMRREYHALRPLADAGIFFLPAGAYMPFLLASFGGVWRWVLFSLLALYAIGGFTLYLTIIGIFRRYAVAAGYSLFFIILPFAPVLSELLGSAGASWFRAAAVLYGFALIARSRERFPYAEALWHAFVMGGATLQYFGIRALVP